MSKSYKKKTDRPVRGSQVAAVLAAGERGEFTRLDVRGPWSRREIQNGLVAMVRRGRVRVVRPARLGWAGPPTVYALVEK